MGSLYSFLSSQSNERPNDQEERRFHQFLAQNTLRKRISRKPISIKPKRGEDITDYTIDEVLQSYTALEQVVCLELTWNEQITKAPDLGKFTSITELDLQGNRISEFPWVPGSTLLILNLSHNDINYIPHNIHTRFMNLEELNLSRNLIEDLPTDLLQLKMLKTFDASNNPRMRSPSKKICDQGKDAIFSALELRGRQRFDLWSTFAPDVGQPASLFRHCCYCILKNDVDYMHPIPLPRVIQENLKEMKNSYIDLAKCSACRNYFTSKNKFDRHVCSRIISG